MTIRFQTVTRHKEIQSPIACPACGRVLEALAVSKVDEMVTAHQRYSCRSADRGVWAE